MAVTLGAKLIEKHFTLNQNFAGPDHWFSANPKDFALMVKKIRKAELLLGKEDFVLSPAETVIKRDCRRSIMVVGKIKKGETIKSDQVALKRPGTGLPAKYLGQIIDRKALRNYSPGYIMKTKDLN